MPHYILCGELRDDLLDYLEEHPYCQVADLIHGLLGSPCLEECVAREETINPVADPRVVDEVVSGLPEPKFAPDAPPVADWARTKLRGVPQ